MPRHSKSPFELAQGRHTALSAKQSVGRTAFMNSLGRLDETGSAAIGRGEITPGRYAVSMIEVYSDIQNLSIVPPLKPEHIDMIAGKLAGFAIVAEANPQQPTGEPTATDTNSIPTDERKA